MDFFYDGQIKRYLTQFMRVMSNFGYKTTNGQVIRVPVIYGDMSRQAAQIIRKNSDAAVPSTPFISCHIKDVQYDITRLQDPTFVSKMSIREREWDPETKTYLYSQGSNYTVERIMPSPFIISFTADIWATSTDQKMQIWEQIIVFFNPSLEIQTTDNYIDWTSLSALTLDGMQWSNKAIAQSVDQFVDVCTMDFKAPIWITPPAKIKKLGIVTKIIADVYALSQGEITADFSDPNAYTDFGIPDTKVVVTPGNYDLLVLDNTAVLIKSSVEASSSTTDIPSGTTSWLQLLDHYPGKFKAGLSQLRLLKSDGNEIVAYITLDSNDETKMILNFDKDSTPSNTVINGRGSVDAIINPETYNPTGLVISGTRFLILENINVNDQYNLPGYDGPSAWKNQDGSDFQAYANDIIEWNGVSWNIIFDSRNISTVTYITNTYTGIQYKWSDNQWTKSFEGLYDRQLWRLIL